ncbi:MAG TPA: hypothetical protein VFH27_05685, partial [Longimicrobiaceae bacterium]|nr:hypothetical protein [Longimicrobiaceae bacterium]
MRTTRLPVRLALAVALLLAGACSDGPTGPHASPGLVTPAAGPLQVAAIACRADMAARRIACGQPSTGTGAAGDLIVGGQNVYIRLASSNLAFIDAPGAAERDTMAV